MSSPRRIFHLARRAAWYDALESGHYIQSTIDRTLDEEGYIHASTAAQVARTADKYYRGRDDIVLLTIDTLRLDVDVVYENTSGGTELFPHLYGPLSTDAVVSAEPVPLDPDGALVLDGLLLD